MLSFKHLSVFTLLTFFISQSSFSQNSDKPVFTYQVQEHLSLGEVALIFYGKSSMAKEIAKWNHLKKPYNVRKNKTLVFMQAPIRTFEEGQKILVKMWFERMNRREKTEYPVQVEIEKKLTDHEKEVVRVFNEEKLKNKVLEQQEKSLSELSAEDHLNIGENLFKDNKFEEALAHFQKSKELNPDSIKVWIYEIKTLDKTNKKDEIKITADSFIKKFPELKEMPYLKTVMSK